MTAKKMLSSIVCLRGERSGYKHLIQSVIVLQGKRISRRMRMEAVKADRGDTTYIQYGMFP